MDGLGEFPTEYVVQQKFPERKHGPTFALDSIASTVTSTSSSFLDELSLRARSELSVPVLFLQVAHYAHRCIPMASWLRKYCKSEWKQYWGKDLSAGIVIGIMLIPQAMAYAMVASLPPHYGFYSSIVPSLIYMVLGSSRHVQLGVNAPISLMVAVSIQSSGAGTELERVESALTLTALGGVFYFLMMIFRLDLVSTFIPDPVMSGFCTAMAFQIMSTNLKYAVGVNLDTVWPLDPEPLTLNSLAPPAPVSSNR
jgi:hypothetical protein